MPSSCAAQEQIKHCSVNNVINWNEPLKLVEEMKKSPSSHDAIILQKSRLFVKLSPSHHHNSILYKPIILLLILYSLPDDLIFFFTSHLLVFVWTLGYSYYYHNKIQRLIFYSLLLDKVWNKGNNLVGKNNHFTPPFIIMA